MKAVVEPLEGNKVKLTIEVDEQEFEKAIDAAFRKIAREVRIPGFRPGKAPRRILEARLGKETGRNEALRDALPDYYSQALREHDVDAIAPPEIDITAGQESGPAGLRRRGGGPTPAAPGRLRGPAGRGPQPGGHRRGDRRPDRPAAGQLRGAVVRRPPGRDGDHLTIDLKGSATARTSPADDRRLPLRARQRHGAPRARRPPARRPGRRHPGLRRRAPGRPGAAQGARQGRQREGPARVTDEWAGEASEFDTVDELRADIRKRMELVKRVQASMALRNGTVEALVELVDADPPAPLVDAEVERRLHDLEHRLEAQRATLDQYLEATGQTPEQVVSGMREGAAEAVKADLALRAVAEAEHLEPTDDDIDAEIDRLAESFKVKPAELRRNLERTDQMPAVRSDWKKSKALEWLVEHVEVVDTDGQPIDRTLLEPDPAPDDSPEASQDQETGEP